MGKTSGARGGFQIFDLAPVLASVGKYRSIFKLVPVQCRDEEGILRMEPAQSPECFANAVTDLLDEAGCDGAAHAARLEEAGVSTIGDLVCLNPSMDQLKHDFGLDVLLFRKRVHRKVQALQSDLQSPQIWAAEREIVLGKEELYK